MCYQYWSNSVQMWPIPQSPGQSSFQRNNFPNRVTAATTLLQTRPQRHLNWPRVSQRKELSHLLYPNPSSMRQVVTPHGLDIHTESSAGAGPAPLCPSPASAQMPAVGGQVWWWSWEAKSEGRRVNGKDRPNWKSGVRMHGGVGLGKPQEISFQQWLI